MTDGLPCGSKSGAQKKKGEYMIQTHGRKPFLTSINSNKSYHIQHVQHFHIKLPVVPKIIDQQSFLETTFPTKLVCIIAVSLSAFNLGCAWENSGDALPSPTLCINCTICQYPCRPLSPPSSGDPSYEAPPLPPALPGYPADVPPPPPWQPGQGKCPPIPIQCCQYPPPPPYGVYVPCDSRALPCPVPNFLHVIMMLLFSSTATF